MKYLLTAIFIFFAQNTQANLIINEVLSNEPGGFTSLEWIEFYNNSITTQQLSDYELVINSDTILLPVLLIEPDSYIIICKKLFSISDEASFEWYWGNGSKVWGDTKYEFKTIEPIELSFSILRNDSGTIFLTQSDEIVSLFRWDEKSNDGVSWERKYPDSTIIEQSKSNRKSTPGYLNSITLVQKDIAIESVEIIVEDFIPFYTFKIANRGQTDVGDGILHIYDSTFSILIQSISIPLITSDSSIRVKVSLEIVSNQIYESLVAITETSLDLRDSNDSLYFTAVTTLYPPVIISEFLANHNVNKDIEWIELYNRSTESIDLKDWFVGDALKLNQIISEPFILEPNQYVVLVKSASDFLAEYPLFDGFIIELASWAILNDSSDRIRLQDNFKITANSYLYNSLYDENYTVSRDIVNGTYKWGRSSTPNGTPGYENDLFQIHENVNLSLSSKYISPDGDGYEDKVLIDIKVPSSESYTLKLYDIDGNIVKTFFTIKELISNQYEWNGLDDNNRRLPIGIYILYLTTDEGVSIKETIVIAR